MQPGCLAWYLSPEEVAYALDLGAARQAVKPPGLSRKRLATWSDELLSQLGTLGELAVARCLGLDLDETIYTCGGDGGVDMKLGDVRIAVKFNHRWPNCYLMVEERVGDSEGSLRDFPGGVAVLTGSTCDPVHGRCNCEERAASRRGWLMYIHGWIDGATFCKVAVKRDWGYGGRWCVSTDQLRPMHELFAYAKQALPYR